MEAFDLGKKTPADPLRLPAVPASQCKFGSVPFVTVSRAKATLYTVRVESRDGSIRVFRAQAGHPESPMERSPPTGTRAGCKSW